MKLENPISPFRAGAKKSDFRSLLYGGTIALPHSLGRGKLVEDETLKAIVLVCRMQTKELGILINT